MNLLEHNLLFFGSLKSHFGNQMSIKVPKGVSLGTVIHMLNEKAPAASDILAVCRIAINTELEKEDFIMEQSCEIAFLPPYSGG